MTPKHGRGTKVYIAAYDVSGQGRSLEPGFDVDTAESTTFGSAAKEHEEGQYKATVDHRGVFTNAVSSWDGFLHNQLGNQSGIALSILPSTPSQGQVAYNAEIKATNVRRAITIEDIVAVEATYDVDGALGRGLAIAYVPAAGGALAGSGYSLGVASSNEQWLVTMHAHEFNGTGSYNIWVEEVSGDVVGNYSVVGATRMSCNDVKSQIIRQQGQREAWARVVTTANSGATMKYTVVVAKANQQ